MWLYTGFDYWVTRLPLMEQELLTLPEHLNSTWFCRVRDPPALVFCSFSGVLCLSFVLFCFPWSCLSSDFCLTLWYFRFHFKFIRSTRSEMYTTTVIEISNGKRKFVWDFPLQICKFKHENFALKRQKIHWYILKHTKWFLNERLLVVIQIATAL